MLIPRRRAPLIAVAPFASATLAATLALLSACTTDELPSGPVTGLGARHGGSAATNTSATFGVAADAGLALRGDARVLDASGFSSYADGSCGVSALVYSAPGASGDAVLSTSTSRKCARTVSIAYQRINPDGTLTAEGSFSGPTFLNVRRIHRIAADGSAEFYVPMGAPAVERTLAFDDGGTKCGTAGTAAIAFVPVLQDGTVTGADPVLVTRVAANEWRVETRPDEVVDGQTVHHDKAWCKGTGALYHMPLRLTVRTPSSLGPF